MAGGKGEGEDFITLGKSEKKKLFPPSHFLNVQAGFTKEYTGRCEALRGGGIFRRGGEGDRKTQTMEEVTSGKGRFGGGGGSTEDAGKDTSGAKIPPFRGAEERDTKKRSRPG